LRAYPSPFRHARESGVRDKNLPQEIEHTSAGGLTFLSALLLTSSTKNTPVYRTGVEPFHLTI
jgi:hypothetical protein